MEIEVTILSHPDSKRRAPVADLIALYAPDGGLDRISRANAFTRYPPPPQLPFLFPIGTQKRPYPFKKWSYQRVVLSKAGEEFPLGRRFGFCLTFFA